ncbi:MAG: glycoside hydrolase family 2, partial [Hymenobacter sp.]
DSQGQTWLADQPRTSPDTWGSESWTRQFPGLNPFFASQRRTFDPIKNTTDGPLLQDFRYGREQLRYAFPVPDGEYLVELYFVEPWLGTGGGLDCTGWRLFDVALNQQTVLHDLDIWKEVGHDQALKKTVKVQVTGGELVLSFPHVASGQALISAIAIASLDASARPAPAPQSLITSLQPADPATAPQWLAQTWLDTGRQVYANQPVTFSALPSTLYGAEWLQMPSKAASAGPRPKATFQVSTAADIYIALDAPPATRPDWLKPYEDTKTTLATDEAGGHLYQVFRRRFAAGALVALGPGSYLVAANRASTIEPAYDLKPTTGYKPATARLSGPGMAKETVNTKESITFREARGGALEWTIQTGVADTYSLTFRYANQLSKPLTARLTLMGADGKLLIKDEQVELLPSKPGKWNYLTTSTGTMINAGSYHVKLSALDAAGLSVSGLDVQ